MIDYRRDHPLTPGQARELYQASTLGQRRPIDDEARFKAMLEHANLVVSAWDGPLLVGIARCLSDFAWVTWLADLAVRQTHQRRGIGRQLIHHCQLAAPQARILLRAAPAAAHYYPHIGFSPATQAWLLEPDHHVA